MSKELCLSISKILNWSESESNIRLEITFCTNDSRRNYLAHKSVIGYYNNSCLVVNASFRINYSETDSKIICKVYDIRDRNQSVFIGEAEIDFTIIHHRKIQFIPFTDHDKVLEVKIIEEFKYDEQSSANVRHSGQTENLEEQREEFLQERYDFLDKVMEKQAKIKKDFSEKVYQLLKDLKSNKNNFQSTFDPKKTAFHPENDAKNQFETKRFGGQTKFKDFLSKDHHAQHMKQPEDSNNQNEQQIIRNSTHPHKKSDRHKFHANLPLEEKGYKTPMRLIKQDILKENYLTKKDKLNMD